MSVSFDENGKAVYVGPKVRWSFHSCFKLIASILGSVLPQVTKRFLDFANWMLAWDRYALGAAMVKQMDFRTAMQHKAVCTEVCALCI